jgi:nucleoside-diphosphate-sugar epimerase
MSAIFVTGGTGLIGRRVIAMLREAERSVYALSRQPQQSADARWLQGDITCDGLALSPDNRRALQRDVTTVVHIAANTSFTQTLEQARAINTEGTRQVLALSADWPRVSRWVYVSTAFVAGFRTGLIFEEDEPSPRCANAYEQSKGEAEQFVRTARTDWTIVRPATIVCDDESGRITQYNAVHRALRLYFGGLAAMLPGTDESRVDVITNEYAARGVALAATSPDALRRTLHLCAGSGALPLDELLDVAYDAFRHAPSWRHKGIVRPIRTDLETYRLFERAAFDAGSDRVKKALRSLGTFVPQLAYPKTFDTSFADALVGPAAPARSFWLRMVQHLVANVEPPKLEAA